MQNKKCKLIFRDTPCIGGIKQMPVTHDKSIYTCKYHAVLYTMLLELHHIYKTDQIAKMSTSEIIRNWTIAFGSKKTQEGCSDGYKLDQN